MPTYEYVCTDCAHEWETEQSIKEDALKDCPKCQHATAKRQISRGTGFILKGSGWYSDLYSGGSNKKAEATPAASTSTDASSTGSTSTGSGTGGGSSSSGSSDSGSSGGASGGGSTGGSGGASASAA